MFVLGLFVLLSAFGKESFGISRRDLDFYTWSIGNDLFNFSRSATRHKELHKKFEMSESKVVPINLDNIFSEVANRMSESLRKKVEAIEKIMFFAEEKAWDHYKNIHPNFEEFDPMSVTFPHSVPSNYTVTFNVTSDLHFGTKVNTNFSSVHVPTSIYEDDTHEHIGKYKRKEKDVKKPVISVGYKKLLQAVSWSSDLDIVFKSNSKENPSLSWQYFGSSTGFLRHYPAMRWPKGDTHSKIEKKDNEDLFDCRMRPWYTGGANSPKNIVILQDVSGSMRGLRTEIAKQVIRTILDTLTENDFVNAYNVTNETIPIVDCFKGRLVQATLENIRQFKIALNYSHTKNISNMSVALNTAFDLLDDHYDQDSGCSNQAIMLITDASSTDHQKLFLKRNPTRHVRVFTYLIGQEVTDFRNVQVMACDNRGYYTNITTIGDVQEKVLKYLPVMSRPMVMSEIHPVSWSSVYADLAQPIESEWLWEDKTRAKQGERSLRYKFIYETFLIAAKKENISDLAKFTTQEEMKAAQTKGKHLPNLNRTKIKNYLDYEKTDVCEKHVRRMQAEQERKEKSSRHESNLFESPYKFVISASLPVFDKRKTNGTNGVYPAVRIAYFLGVAGTDIPIKELQKMTNPFHLGVNSYAFMITNNGYVVFHPDWRPLHEEILRPNYNTVDLTHVELIYPDENERNRAQKLLDVGYMRKEMIDKDTENVSKWKLLVKSHGDNFRRVRVKEQQYVFGKIPGTPYTLALVAPIDSINSNRFVGAIDVWRYLRATGSGKDRGRQGNVFDSSDKKQKWRVNPDWTYCEYIGSRETKFFDENPEKLLVHFLHQIQQSNHSWTWTVANGSSPYICDKDLVQSLVFDAELTQGFAPDERFLRLSGLGNATAMTFIATRTGLTRWIDFYGLDDSDIPFLPYHKKATEELWYKRTVDWNEIDEDIFVFSVPFDAGTNAISKVTATQTIFVRKGPLKAPVAVVGLQLDLDKLLTYFSFSLPPVRGRGNTYSSKNICQNSDYDCFMLDENGFIVISEFRDDIGQFFGQVDGNVMEILIRMRIYDEISVTDFQAACLHELHPRPKRSNFANILATPYQQLKWLFNWFLGNMIWLAVQFNLKSFFSPGYDGFVFAEYLTMDDKIPEKVAPPHLEEAYIPKTKLQPCDKKYNLYSYSSEFMTVSNKSYYHHPPNHESCDHRCDDFLNVQRIPKTNLLLVIIQSKCRCESEAQAQKISIEGVEIEYEMHPEFVEKVNLSRVLLQLCRIPYAPLYRKAPNPYCYEANEEEDKLQKDCGISYSPPLKPRQSYLYLWILTIFELLMNP